MLIRTRCKTVSELQAAYKNYKAGSTDTPIYEVEGLVTKSVDEDLAPKVVLTKELTDRDGETLIVDGIKLTNFKKNPKFLDSHKARDSVLTSTLGKIENIKRCRDDKGVKQLCGKIKFAPTPNGQLAKALVDGGFANTVSLGFLIYEMDTEDPQNVKITKSELFEVSLVNVPANAEAMIEKSTQKAKDRDKQDEEVIKAIKNYKSIHKKIKQYRKLFMSDTICSLLNYSKCGKELVDVKNVFDLIVKRISETHNADDSPTDQVENQAESVAAELVEIARQRAENQ